jgi:ornithine cyclodeaminase
MQNGDILVLKAKEISGLLAGKELELIDIARRAYEAHAAGKSSLPHSTFLRFPESPSDRVIALPAYLGDSFEVAGLKWISSFPGNLDRGIERASAVMIMNSMTTGRPESIMEGSVISAKRTAASAALAAKYLTDGQEQNSLGLIGCGLINFEIARFIMAALPDIKSFTVFDRLQGQAQRFQEKCEAAFAGVTVEVAQSPEDVLSSSRLISFATTAVEPHISDLSPCPKESTILHISLRDLTPELILANDNIVDDIDHVCRAQTSIHLAEQLAQNRDFVRCTIADITSGRATARCAGRHAIYSPFGLGVLDIAVGKSVHELATANNCGLVIDSFIE